MVYGRFRLVLAGLAGFNSGFGVWNMSIVVFGNYVTLLEEDSIKSSPTLAMAPTRLI